MAKFYNKTTKSDLSDIASPWAGGYEMLGDYTYVPYARKQDMAARKPTPECGPGLSDTETNEEDYFESASLAQTIDLISEGPIDGFCGSDGETIHFYESDQSVTNEHLKSIYLNDTVVLNEKDGSYNFRVFDADFRHGQEIQNTFGRSYNYQGKTVPINTQLFPANSTLDTETISPAEMVDLQSVDFANPSIKQLLNLGIDDADGVNAQVAVDLSLDYKKGNEIISGKIPREAKQLLNRQNSRLENYLHPVVHTITDPNVEKVSIAINIQALSKNIIGKRTTSTGIESLSFLIYVNNEQDTDVDQPPILEITSEMEHSSAHLNKKSLGRRVEVPGGISYSTDAYYRAFDLIENDSGGYFVRKMSGLATSDYLFETVVHLPPNPSGGKRIVRVSMLDQDKSFKGSKSRSTVAASLHSVTEFIPCRLTYPNSAIIASTVDSRAFSSIPSRKFLLKLLKVKVPSNYIPDTKEYIGNWNGKFKSHIHSGTSSASKVGSNNFLDKLNTQTRDAKEIDQLSDTVKIKHVPRFGSGALFFPQSTGFNKNDEQAKSIRVKDPQSFVSQAYNKGGFFQPKVEPFGSYGTGNFTIEFYMKATEAQIKNVFNLAGGSNQPNGVENLPKIIIASEENAGMPNGVGFDVGTKNASEISFNSRNFQALLDSYGDKNIAYRFLSDLFGGAWRVEIGTKDSSSFDNLDLGKIRFRAWTPIVIDTEGRGKLSWTFKGWEANGIIEISDKIELREVARVQSTTNVADNSWHHIAISKNGSIVRLFIDGTREDSDTVQSGLRIQGFKYITENIPKYNTADLIAAAKDSIGPGSTGTSNSEDFGKGEVQIGGSRTPWNKDNYGTSYAGYLDEIMISNSAKYTTNFNSSPDHVTQLIKNDFDTALYINADNENTDSTNISDTTEIVVSDPDGVDDLGQASPFRVSEESLNSSALLQWTDNPAWIIYDLVTNKKHGLGRYGIKAESIDKWSLYEIAKYCDEKVKTGYNPKYKAREFQVVFYNQGSEAEAEAGADKIKITGFSNQKQFEDEFPEYSTIALYDLNDKAEPVHRRIKYLTSNAVSDSKLQTNRLKSDGEQLISYVAANKDSAGYAIIELHRLISVEEALIIQPGLNEYIKSKKSVSGTYTSQAHRLATAKELILEVINNPDAESSELTTFFDTPQIINKSSVSGIVATEFNNHFDILEPRFSANLYLKTQVDAYKLLNDIASIFRGITYFANGKIFSYHDKKRDPIFNFTNDNVKDGDFVYSGSSKSERFTTCVVRYVDKYEQYKPKVEYVEDADGIVKYGILEKELVAFGCASRSQAKRLGKWFLFTSQYETETVSFSGGKECGYLRPGDVIRIMDKTRSQKRFGGRVVDFVPNELKLKLDLNLSEDYVGEQIHITTIKDFEFSDSLDEKSDKMIIDEVGSTGQQIFHQRIEDEDIAKIRSSQITTYKIKSIEPDKSLTPVENRIVELETLGGDPPENFGKIKIGSIFILNQKSGDVKTQDQLYKVINVSEENDLEYKVEALEYHKSKFDLADNKENAQNQIQNTKTPIEYSRPAKPIGIPEIRVIPLKSGTQRRLIVSWEEVNPTPEEYKIAIIFNSRLAHYNPETGEIYGILEPGQRLETTMKAKRTNGAVADTSISVNIGAYAGDIDIEIYTVDANGNLDLIYY